MTSARPRPHPHRQGFTLIELLVVMAIIAVLISITIPAVFKAREAANRSTCSNNLRQFGLGFMSHQHQYNYFPTAGGGSNPGVAADYSAPIFASGSGTSIKPVGGFRQDAGWGFQVLPFIDAEPIWDGSSAAGTAAAKMQAAAAPPLKLFFCPSRRPPSQNTGYTNAKFPSETAYSALLNQPFTVALCDYAACNGTTPGAIPGSGTVLSQANGRTTISTADIRDGVSYTLLLAEKAANPRGGPCILEDDMGYFAAYGGTNFNTVRFTSQTLMPLRDFEATCPTGGAFGSPHPGTWTALMADGSVQQLSYSIAPNIYQALGTIQGGEIISDIDLSN
jgi:prepilin-type N-terminal cleavage/methylation domain-containing protein